MIAVYPLVGGASENKSKNLVVCVPLNRQFIKGVGSWGSMNPLHQL